MPHYELTRKEGDKTFTLNTIIEAAEPESAINKMVRLSAIYWGKHSRNQNDGKWLATEIQI